MTGGNRMNKYIVFLREQRAEVVSEELKKWLIDASPWGFGWNRKLLAKTGADITIWAKSEAEALERSNNRWRRFNLDELNELLKSVRNRHQIAKEFVREEQDLYSIASLLHELQEIISRLKEENRLDSEFMKALISYDLPF
jgi:type I restriction-modification system DNA methylase subunit